MIILVSLALIGLASGQNMTWGPLFVQPQQIHLSWGANETQMIVTWVTFDLPKEATVVFGQKELNSRSVGTTSMFVDGGTEKRQMFIHRVTISGLEADTRYVYRCGSTDGWSPIFTFKTLKSGHDWTARFCVYGDLGNINGRSIGGIQDEVQKGLFDAVLHVGDMAYDLHTDNARVGDEFMRQIEPIAAYAPYQVLPGNHENTYNFSNYDNRFSMVNSGTGQPNNLFWSYDVGAVHLVAMSTEFYFYPKWYTRENTERQFRWLEEDLKRANLKENRKMRPWIVVMGHRPLYCQHYWDEVLVKGIKTGDKYEFGLEKLFFDQGVDLEIWGHIHDYQRLWPMYNFTVMNGSTSEPYKNPKAPVHIITGSPGNREGQTVTRPTSPNFISKVFRDYGYTRMFVNQTHLKLEQVSVNKNGKIIDEIVITQDNHGPFKENK